MFAMKLSVSDKILPLQRRVFLFFFLYFIGIISPTHLELHTSWEILFHKCARTVGFFIFMTKLWSQPCIPGNKYMFQGVVFLCCYSWGSPVFAVYLHAVCRHTPHTPIYDLWCLFILIYEIPCVLWGRKINMQSASRLLMELPSISSQNLTLKLLFMHKSKYVN